MDTNVDFKTNYHTHTFRCHHASGSDEEYVLEAIANGYKVLGFSDHACWEYSSKYVSRIRMRVQEFEEYKRSVLYLKKNIKSVLPFCSVWKRNTIRCIRTGCLSFVWNNRSII